MPHKELLDPQGKTIKKNMPNLDIHTAPLQAFADGFAQLILEADIAHITTDGYLAGAVIDRCQLDFDSMTSRRNATDSKTCH